MKAVQAIQPTDNPPSVADWGPSRTLQLTTGTRLRTTWPSRWLLAVLNLRGQVPLQLLNFSYPQKAANCQLPTSDYCLMSSLHSNFSSVSAYFYAFLISIYSGCRCPLFVCCFTLSGAGPHNLRFVLLYAA